MMKRRLSVISLVVIAVLCLLPFFIVLITYFFFVNGVDEANTQKKIDVINYATLGDTLIKAGFTDDLRARLREAYDSNYIGFFVVKKNGLIVDWENQKHDFDKINFVYRSDGKLVFLKDRFFTSVTRGEYQIVVGAYSNPPNFVTFVFGESGRLLYGFFRDVALATILIGAIVYFYFRDIRDAVSILRRQNGRDFLKAKSKSIESEVLNRGFRSFQNQVEGLNKENRILKNQVLSALRSEIMSGKEPPYEFFCTLVRMDVNNFSHIFSKFSIEDFMGVIDEFFQEATHIVSRYKGYVYEFVGDEIIFYFKDEEHENSSIAALSAIRDINQEASRISERTKIQNGYPFVVKSSVSSGKLRFGKQVDGYSLAGSILIETVRILSHIHEKDENVVFYRKILRERVEPICASKFECKAMLKGFSEETILHSYLHHRDLSELLESLDITNSRLLAHYRSDRDMVQIIRHLRMHLKTLDRPVFLAVTATLKEVEVSNTGLELKSEYLSTLDELHNQLVEKIDESILFYFSSFLSIANRVISKDAYDHRISKALISYLKIGDRRVVANILDVFSNFDAENSDSVFMDLLSSNDNRISANAIIKEGRRELTKNVISRLESMLRSKSSLQVASALYALGELVMHYRKTDSVYLETHTRFLHSVHKLFSYFEHKDPMVRRQSLIAARKAGDFAGKILELHKRAPANLRSEIDQYYYCLPLPISSQKPARIA
jgi:hypothetical protein